jgi:simple sugar transport system ATP-binding protein
MVKAKSLKYQPTNSVLAVEMLSICKRFPGVDANRNIDLELRKGEVHALLGENGAGKSTLMKVLAGLYRPDSGQIKLSGETIEIQSPADAISLGIGMVHQNFQLVDNMTVAENLHIGWEKTPWYISRNKLADSFEEVTSRFGYQSLKPDTLIWQLSVGEQQQVEILRVLARGAKVLILDEPTAVLTPLETAELFKTMRDLVSQGHIVVFISHKLKEVLEISDRVTVLRHGMNIATHTISECDEHMLASLMVGKRVDYLRYNRTVEVGSPVLEIRDLSALNDRGLPALRGIGLKVREGEILGIAGVSGNGQRELSEVLAGMRPLQSGKILIGGKDCTGSSPSHFTLAGVGYIPEDRVGMGLLLNLSVTHNAVLKEYRDSPIRKGFRIDRSSASQIATDILSAADIRVPNLQVAVRCLSGGNQQKLLIYREMRMAGHLLLAAYPSRGLDVAATDNIRCLIAAHRNDGKGVLLISEDLDELFQISDRIAVIHDGRIVGDFEIERANREEIGLLMGGVES